MDQQWGVAGIDPHKHNFAVGVIDGCGARRDLAAFDMTEDGFAELLADAKSRKNYAGTSPITRASGKSRVVLARYARNKRLADGCYFWAFAALNPSPGARAFYDAHREVGDTHHQALRALGNRLVGILHGCLRHHTPYDEHTAWAHRTELAA